jgi:hypothetical protein
MSGFLSGGGISSASTDTFSSLFSLTGNSLQTIPNSSGAIALGIKAGVTLVEGAQVTLEIPAGSASSLTFASALNVEGDGTINGSGVLTDLDVSADYRLISNVVGGRIVSILRKLATVDSTAPTVQSATVSVITPNRMTVVYSESVTATDVVGLSLTFTSGTARTVTGIISGSGTSSIIYSLSGSFDGTEACKFVVGSIRTCQDTNGNLVSTNGAGTDVTLSFGLSAFGFHNEWDARRSRTPSNGTPVSAIGDLIGSVSLSEGTASRQPDYTNSPRDTLTFTAASLQRLSTNAGTTSSVANPNNDFTLVAHCDFTGQTGTGSGICFAGGAVGLFRLQWRDSGVGAQFLRLDDTATHAAIATKAVAAGKITIIGRFRASTSIEIWDSVNQVWTAASSPDLAGTLATSSVAVAIGSFRNSNGFGDHLNGKWYHAGIKGSAIADGDAVNIHNTLAALHA